MGTLDQILALLRDQDLDSTLYQEQKAASLLALGMTEQDLALEVKQELERRAAGRAGRRAGDPWEGPSPRHGSSDRTRPGG
jgi:hypothetical protein